MPTEQEKRIEALEAAIVNVQNAIRKHDQEMEEFLEEIRFDCFNKDLPAQVEVRRGFLRQRTIEWIRHAVS